MMCEDSGCDGRVDGDFRRCASVSLVTFLTSIFLAAALTAEHLSWLGGLDAVLMMSYLATW